MAPASPALPRFAMPPHSQAFRTTCESLTSTQRLHQVGKCSKPSGKYTLVPPPPSGFKLDPPREPASYNAIGLPCGLWLPYRWVALTAVLIVGAHLIIRVGRRA